jgi:competence protein ComGC
VVVVMVVVVMVVVLLLLGLLLLLLLHWLDGIVYNESLGKKGEARPATMQMMDAGMYDQIRREPFIDLLIK